MCFWASGETDRAAGEVGGEPFVVNGDSGHGTAAESASGGEGRWFGCHQEQRSSAAQSVEGVGADVLPGITGQRLFQLPPAAQQTPQRIRAQLLVIVQILAAQSSDALRRHLPDRVFDPLRIPAIAEAVRQPPQQVDAAVHQPPQQRPAVARYPAGGKPGLHPARKWGARKTVSWLHSVGKDRSFPGS